MAQPRAGHTVDAPTPGPERRSILGHTGAAMRLPPDRCALPRRRACLAAAATLAPAWLCAAELPDEQPVIVMLPAGGASIELQFTPGFDAAQRERAMQWVRAAAAAAAGYFGRFPVPQLELLLVGGEGAGVRSGVSFGAPAPRVRVRLGHATTAEQYRHDRVLVHEMVHLAVPRVPRPQAWLHEGIATYVETLARAHAGLLDAATVWRSWAQRMPAGQPAAGDRGLDHTPTWARVYWGGALFCLLADVRWRQQGTAARGLQQALQGVLAAGGDYRVAWRAERILATADAALGLRTASALYRAWKDRPVRVDLTALWRELGVDGERLRDDAPLAAVRRAILA